MRHPRPTVLTLPFAALVGLASFAPALAQAGPDQSRPVHGVNPADMDPAADRRQDFHRFANGGWLNRTELPADRPSYGLLDELHDRNTASCAPSSGQA